VSELASGRFEGLDLTFMFTMLRRQRVWVLGCCLVPAKVGDESQYKEGGVDGMKIYVKGIGLEMPVRALVE
jgi:hypothetical protein